jgi:hypothetical protein
VTEPVTPLFKKNVAGDTVEASMASLKVAVIAAFAATPVALFPGLVDETVGATASGGVPPPIVPPPPQPENKTANNTMIPNPNRVARKSASGNCISNSNSVCVFYAALLRATTRRRPTSKKGTDYFHPTWHG